MCLWVCVGVSVTYVKSFDCYYNDIFNDQRILESIQVQLIRPLKIRALEKLIYGTINVCNLTLALTLKTYFVNTFALTLLNGPCTLT